MSSVEATDGIAPEAGFYRFLRYGHVLRSLLREFLEQDFLRQVCPHPLTRSQFCFLKLIAANADLQVGEVARCLGVSPAATSRNLDKLVRIGLVIREASREDRRVTLLSASAAGVRLVAEYERLKAAQLAPVIAALGPDKTDQLCELLREVCVGILSQVENPRDSCLRCAGYYQPDCAFEQLHGECALRPRQRGDGTPGGGMEA